MAIVLSQKERLMLALLAEGAPSKTIAHHLKVVPGTARVYLCKLYRKLKVSNKTTALNWYRHHYITLDTDSPSPQSVPHYKTSTSSEAGLRQILPVDCQEFGSYALKRSLFTALGAASTFIGPKMGLQKGENNTTSSKIRFLWEWLLQGNFDAAVNYVPYEDDERRLNDDEPCEEALLSMLLFLGDVAREKAADKASRALKRQKIAPFSCAVVQALKDINSGNEVNALLDLHRYVAEIPPCHPAKHAAMVVLFHIYRKRGNTEHAKALANAIYAEAQGVQYLAVAQKGFSSVRASHNLPPA